MAYLEGREARRNGRLQSENPYLPTMPQHAMWLEGWRDSDAMLRALGLA